MLVASLSRHRSLPRLAYLIARASTLHVYIAITIAIAIAITIAITIAIAIAITLAVAVAIAIAIAIVVALLPPPPVITIPTYLANVIVKGRHAFRAVLSLISRCCEGFARCDALHVNAIAICSCYCRHHCLHLSFHHWYQLAR